MESANPESVGFSSARLERITRWLNGMVKDEKLAGASVLIGRRGKVAYFESAGVEDLDSDQDFDRQSVVRIFSMTKAVTTVAAMMLYEEGCFQLDDPVSLFIPAFGATRVWAGGDAGIDQTVEQASPMLVRHLMTHTSGLTYGFMHANAVDAAYRKNNIEFPGTGGTLADLVERVAGIPLLCQPGSQWNYSVSTDVLGRLVEIWSGQSLETFFHERLFKPLKMKQTGFNVQASLHNRFASLYTPLTGGDMSSVGKTVVTDDARQRGGLKLADAGKTSRYLAPTALYSGGGGLTSTIDDYARFCQMLLNKGVLEGERILGRKTVEFMRKNQLPDNCDMAAMGQPVWSETSYEGIGFGIGFAVVLDPVKANIIASVGEHHWGGAASTFFWIDPAEDLYVVFFTQLMPSSTYPIRRELRQRVYQALVD